MLEGGGPFGIALNYRGSPQCFITFNIHGSVVSIAQIQGVTRTLAFEDGELVVNRHQSGILANFDFANMALEIVAEACNVAGLLETGPGSGQAYLRLYGGDMVLKASDPLGRLQYEERLQLQQRLRELYDVTAENREMHHDPDGSWSSNIDNFISGR